MDALHAEWNTDKFNVVTWNGWPPETRAERSAIVAEFQRMDAVLKDRVRRKTRYWSRLWRKYHPPGTGHGVWGAFPFVERGSDVRRIVEWYLNMYTGTEPPVPTTPIDAGLARYDPNNRTAV